MSFPIYDKADDVPEAFRPEYEERDGKWHPKIPDVASLTSALETERTKAEDERKARNKAERERDELKRKQAAAETGITDEQLQTLRDEDATKRKPIEDENAALKAENRKLKLNDRVRAEASTHWLPDRIEDGMLLVVDGPKPRLTLASDSDAIVVLDKEGKPTTETLEHFLSTTFKSEKPWLYQGSGASGSGAAGSGGSPNGTQQPRPAQEAVVDKRRMVAGSF